MGWVEGGQGLVFRMMISSVIKTCQNDELTVWYASLSAGSVETFADRRSLLLRVDII